MQPAEQANQFRREMGGFVVDRDVTDLIEFRDGRINIGGGSYSHVDSVWYHRNGRGVGTKERACLKTLRLSAGSGGEPDWKVLLRRFIREGRIWSSLSHPHVTPFYGWALEVSDYDVRACFVSQFCSRRDLPQYLRTEPGASKSRLIHEIATGLMYLHEKGVVHGDIKPTNVLVTYEGSAMLCDFGLSMALEDTSTHPQGSSRNTTPEFSAPELILFDSRDPPPRSKSTDVWAFGCTAMQILRQRRPYDRKNLLLIARAMEAGILPFEDFGPHPLELVLQHCILFAPQGRLKISDAVSRITRLRTTKAWLCARAVVRFMMLYAAVTQRALVEA